jgi:hypothetical protein
MNRNINIVAGIAILMTAAVPPVAAAQISYLAPGSQTWSHMAPANVPFGDLAAYAPKRQHGRYIENPNRQFVPADSGMTPGFPANGGGG